jgi:hypothetical protein
MISTIIALIVILGGGASIAAESTVPGEMLYPVKINVNENVRAWVSLSDESKARLDAWRAQRRLSEASELAVENKLDADTRAQIETRLESNVDAFTKRVEEMRADDEVNDAAEVSSDFEATLRAKEAVLIQIARTNGHSNAEVQTLLNSLHARVNTIASARTKAETEVSTGASTDVEAAAEGKLKAAENKVSETKEFIARVTSSAGASVTAEAEAQLSLAENAVARGKTQLDADAYAQAFSSFSEGLRLAQEAHMTASSAKTLELKMEVGANTSMGVGASMGSTETNTHASSSSSTDVKVKGDVNVNAGI